MLSISECERGTLVNGRYDCPGVRVRMLACVDGRGSDSLLCLFRAHFPPVFMRRP